MNTSRYGFQLTVGTVVPSGQFLQRYTGTSVSSGHKIVNKGFTLIEVLVAMTIIAVGVSALVVAAGSSVFRADYLREREFGRWIASNALTEVQVLPAWPDVGTKNKDVEMGRFTWSVRTRTQAVADPDLRRVDIEVRRDKDVDSYIYAVAGFVGNPETRQ